VPDHRDVEPLTGLPGTAGVPPVHSAGPEWRSRRYLPHYDRPALVQMITFRLVDSLPATALSQLASLAVEDPRRRTRLEVLLDSDGGRCFLGDPRVARIVESALWHFDDRRYHLLAWVIMPNHVHVLIETVAGHPLASVVGRWKSFTAKRANSLLHRTGAFWWPDYFDRAIRDERHLERSIEYIHSNPVKAGLAEYPAQWPFSSASSGRPSPGTGRRPAVPDGVSTPRLG